MKRTYFLTNILAFLAIITFTTCCTFPLKVFNSVEGNGNKIKSDRHLTGFDKLKVCCGIEVILTQDSYESVVIETDENIQEYIKTEVEGNTIIISRDNINLRNTTVKAYVSAINMGKIHASSGSSVKSENEINAESMSLESSSGADIKVSIQTKYVKCRASSGASVKVSGKAPQMDADASSGADIKAVELISEICKAHASSGASVKVFASDEIVADASSGGSIHVEGSPRSKDIQKSSGGSVSVK